MKQMQFYIYTDLRENNFRQYLHIPKLSDFIYRMYFVGRKIKKYLPTNV